MLSPLASAFAIIHNASRTSFPLLFLFSALRRCLQRCKGTETLVIIFLIRFPLLFLSRIHYARQDPLFSLFIAIFHPTAWPAPSLFVPSSAIRSGLASLTFQISRAMKPIRRNCSVKLVLPYTGE